MKIHSLLKRIKRVNFLLFISGYINAVVYLVFLYIFLYREFVPFEILISVAILVINYFLAMALIWLGYLMWEGKRLILLPEYRFIRWIIIDPAAVYLTSKILNSLMHRNRK